MTEMHREITCCFTGHRPEKLPWKNNESDPDCAALKQVLFDTLEALYDAGYRRFIGGMASGADIYFGEAVAALRDTRPDVILEGIVPFQGQERRWSAAWRRRYARLSEACDRLTVLHPAHTPGCMMERNRRMVDSSSLLIAVYDGRPGGTRNTVNYAVSQGLTVIQLPVSGLAERISPA